MMATVAMMGFARGSMTCQNTLKKPAPSMIAASSNSFGKRLK